MRGAVAPALRARPVREERAAAPLPLFLHAEWARRFPWLVQGTTARGAEQEPFDLRWFGEVPAATVWARWTRLRQATGCPRAVHALQVHGAEVLVHGAGPPGVFLAEGADGHVTRDAGVLLTVSVADCVPISLVDAEQRAVALLHGGWRGIAAGVLEAGVARLAGAAGSRRADLHLHLGPAICGACYEVGAEVHAALGLERRPAPGPVDLRALLAGRAAALGIPGAQVTSSSLCTRCGNSPFFSHRAGSPGRQLGVLGLRPTGAQGV
ncbi:MAG: polyphenol oxidase family protein [Gemmatimonadetes bacterium]|nr:polyphenol oxidase family protein [Gemmatimonadota bacterium]